MGAQLTAAIPTSWSPATWAVFLFVAGAFAVLALKLVWGMAQWRKKTPYRVGEDMKNTRAMVTEWSGDQGYVRAGGERWRASSKDLLAAGDAVTIVRVDGLNLEVMKKQSDN